MPLRVSVYHTPPIHTHQHPGQIAAVQDKVAAVTEEIHVPPAELTTNTEDLLRQRQAQIQQQQQ